jgi:adenosylhomocysteine nucleosidase
VIGVIIARDAKATRMNSNEVAAVDAAKADIGLVCALPIEIGDFLGRCKRVKSYSGGHFKFCGGLYDDIRIVIVEAGTGQKRAKRATSALIDAHAPRWIVSTGFAGSLRDEIKIGHIAVANQIVGPENEVLTIDVRMTSDPSRGLHVGRFFTADHMVRTVAEKRSLAEEHEAIAVDMESLAVAAICRDSKTRFMAVRSISDDLSSDLPPEVLSLVGETGAVRFGAVLGSLWKRPSSAKDMWRMRENAMLAAERLADFLDGIVVQLHRATS